MGYRLRVWLLIVLLASACSIAVWRVAVFRDRQYASVDSWVARIPTRDALLVYLNPGALRQSGLLQWLANNSATEPEYQVFVRKTGFDYTEDLESVLASFGPTGKYFVVKGQFDWQLLQNYTESQGGLCRYTFCTLNGSTPERKISFFPLTRKLMALAVSEDATAAQSLGQPAPTRLSFRPPDTPVWAYFPASLLKQGQNLPESTRPFASILQKADGLLLTLAVGTNGLAAGLDVQCRSEQDAATLQAQLQQATSLLKEIMQRENHAPDARDLSGVLTAGSFRHSGSHLTGAWPIPRAFLEAVLGG